MSVENAIVALDGAQLPAHLQGKEPSKAGGMVVSADSLPRISAKDSQFVLRDGEREMKLPIGQSLPIVILGVDPAEGTSKSYYATGFKEGSHEAPDCSSADGVMPDTWGGTPQNKDCATCPHNQWGSGRDQAGEPTKGKRCSDRKNLITAIGGKLDKTLFLLSIAPTSLKNMSRYARSLVKHGVDPENVLTVVGFDPDKPKVLTFDFGGFLSAADNILSETRAASAEVTDHVTGPAPAPMAELPPAVAVPELSQPAAVADTTSFFEDETPVGTVGEQLVVEQPAAVVAPVVEAVVVAPVVVAEQSTELDTSGLPWDGRINAKNKSKTVGGTWKMGRGITAEAIAAVHAELRGGGVTQPVAAVVAEAAAVVTPEVTPPPVQEPVTAPADVAGILDDWD